MVIVVMLINCIENQLFYIIITKLLPPPTLPQFRQKQ